MICVAVHNRVRCLVELRVYDPSQTDFPAACCSVDASAFVSGSGRERQSVDKKIERALGGAFGPHVEAEVSRVRAVGLWKPAAKKPSAVFKGRKWDKPALVQDFNDPGD